MKFMSFQCEKVCASEGGRNVEGVECSCHDDETRKVSAWFSPHGFNLIDLYFVPKKAHW